MAKFVELLLTAIQFQAEGLFTIADVLLATPAKSRQAFHRLPTYQKRWFKTNWAEAYRNRQQFYATLNYLKRSDLVVKKSKQGRSRWAVTAKGRERIKEYQGARNDPFSSASISFSQIRGDGITIVSFDIPEKERKKRDWVRVCLISMGFKYLQKSVWVGNGAVGEDFVFALRERKLLDNVHIFRVSAQGTVHA